MPPGPQRRGAAPSGSMPRGAGCPRACPSIPTGGGAPPALCPAVLRQTGLSRDASGVVRRPSARPRGAAGEPVPGAERGVVAGWASDSGDSGGGHGSRRARFGGRADPATGTAIPGVVARAATAYGGPSRVASPGGTTVLRGARHPSPRHLDQPACDRGLASAAPGCASLRQADRLARPSGGTRTGRPWRRSTLPPVLSL